LNKALQKSLFFFSILLLLAACSAKKNAFINRGFHSVTTKYNVLYNGQIAFDQEKQQIDDSYDDNFWERLPIEPLKIEEKELEIPVLPGQEKPEEEEESLQGFEKAEYKAIKAIQKHSMDIEGVERNGQIDDAYLLLGKTRYYSQRFIPALEAFNFILGNYTDLPLRDETKIWQAKTLVRLQNEKLATETLDILLQDDGLPLKVIENGYTTKAMVYESLDSTEAVIKNLNEAVLYSVNPKLKARNLFILGQLYREQNNIDSSNIAFENLINFRKAPYRYKIHAQIDRAKNYTKSDSSSTIIKTLSQLIEDRDNRLYLDELYYQKALIEIENDSIDKAVVDLKESIIVKDAKPFQQELSYEQLGNIYFDKADFKFAGSYYDSVLQLADNRNTIRIRRLTRKRKSLDEVILFETIAQVNDSILTVAAMSEDEQKEFYQKHIDKLKIEAEEAKRREEELASSSGFGNLNNDSSSDSNTGGTFYFYNVQAAGFGEQNFKRIWGNRTLEDNWRLSDKQSIGNFADANQLAIIVDAIDDDKKFDLDYYLSRIPKEQKEIDSISLSRNDAYYNLGLIYKEQFKKYELAAERLEKLLTFPPKENLILPIKYHLYKIYENFDVEKSNKYKEEVVSNYPDSRYAAIILNPQEVLSFDDGKQTPENVYNEIYCRYDFQHYEEVLEKSEKAIKQFEDLPIIPKFELLKAYALKQTQGPEAFKNALNYVALSYPNTEEGKHAIKILADANKNIIATEKENIKTPLQEEKIKN